MFYLKIALKKNYLHLSFLLVLTAAFFVAVLTPEIVKSGFGKIFSRGADVGPVVELLHLEGESLEEVRVKLLRLPGVKRVERIDSDTLNGEVKQLLNNSTQDREEVKLDITYTGLRISFNPETSLKSVELIKEYVAKYVGEEKIIFGKTLENKENQNDILGFDIKNIVNYSDWILLSLIISLGAILNMTNLNQKRNHLYLLKSFRRSGGNVIWSAKILVTLCGALLGITISLILSSPGNIHFFRIPLLILFFLPLFFFYSKKEWKS